MRVFSHYSFSRAELRVQKARAKLTVGVALPVKNNAPTLPRILSVLARLHDIVDEIITVDSGSVDTSAAICKRFGIRHIADERAAKNLGAPLHRGKGWNLWTSLYYLKTDVVLWIDADIVNFGPRFVLGLIAPFLVDKRIQFVKGFYERPKNDARVTEILVRPYLNLVLPELSRFVQPLAGEYGGRRSLLEHLDFYSGYSVDVALLLQCVERLDSRSIAQVYLGKRIHRLQSVNELGRMGAGILRTLLLLSHERKRILLTSKKLPRHLFQFTPERIADVTGASFPIADVQLPPPIRFPGNAHE